MPNSQPQAFLGIFAFLALAWLAGERRRVPWKPVAAALSAQVVLALLILRVNAVQYFFVWLAGMISGLKRATLVGTSFVFGYVGGGPTPFLPTPGGNTFVFAAQALPMIVVVSSLAMVLFHWRVLPVMVRAFSAVLSRTLHVGGALGVCAAAKVFLGQTEAPLLIRPYIAKLTRSELLTMMSLGMATTSAATMVLYAQVLEHTIANPITHILTASLISVPAAVAISRVMIPQLGPDTEGTLVAPYEFSGFMDAVARGAIDGMQLLVNILALLIATLSLVALLDTVLANVSVLGAPLSLQRVVSPVLAPIAWLMGIPWSEAMRAGGLLGTKVVLNEFMAFIDLTRDGVDPLSEHTRLVMTYALCGFANFGSVGIQIGGLGTLVPERRQEILSLGFQALLAGSLATCLSGTLVGLIAG